MSGRLTVKEVYEAYKKWVINNPNVVSDAETIATWTSYFVAGKMNKSPIVSELIYSLSKLLSLFNDRLISEAYGVGIHHYGLHEQIKLCMTVIHYSEVFIELSIRNLYGNKGKWTVVTLLQIFKCCSALVLLFRFKELPICHPAIEPLQRKNVTEDNDVSENTNSFIILQRSGRVMRRVDGAPPIAIRDWQPVKVKDAKSCLTIEVKELLYAELIHVIKPLVQLSAIKVFGIDSWKQWFISLCLDLTSMRFYNRNIQDLSYEQRIEISRRKLALVLYLLRSPMYKGYSKNVIESILTSATNKIPMMEFLCGPIIQYLNHWQDIYFYIWSS